MASIKKSTKKSIKKEAELPKDFAKAFKPADIRAIYPTQIDEELAYRVARAFVVFYKLKKVIVGRDMRLSSPSLAKSFIKGLKDQGANVVDIGLTDTPGTYFASGKMNLYGAMITASHNPKEYNGIKLVKAGAIPLTEEDGLQDIRALVIANDFAEPKKKGTVVKKDILESYKKYLHSFVSINKKRKVRIVVDAGNGMSSKLRPILEYKSLFEIVPLFFKLDGSFPNRGSDPTVERNMEPVKAHVKKMKPDFGVAFDGDVDRVGFFDEEGRYVDAAVVGALITKHLLEEKKKLKIVYNNFTSKSFLETIIKYGGTPVRAKVGHSFIKNIMREEDAVFSCEHSAHFYFKENFYTDSGIIALLRIVEEYANPKNEGKKFSEIVAEFNKYKQTEEVLIEVSKKEEILKTVEDMYKGKNPLKLDTFDGLYVEFADYWFCLAKSITEDALKLVLEAVDEKTMQERQAEILALVKKLDA